MTTIQDLPEHGAVLDVPLNKLKASPRNARKTPHASADVEALAASIGARGLIQALVVEPERDDAGVWTSFFLVTVGEGRRLAFRLRAKRKEIARNAPVRCVVDLENDPFEVSLDENVTRFAMHPADQFEAFQQLAAERGFGPEEIAARFGVTPAIVKQRLRLAAVSPRLMSVYRAGEMTLDQLMVFTITDDHAHQEQVWDGLAWNKDPGYIRRLLTDSRVRATDRRALFVGVEAYAEAGGVIERDLFSEDQGGYLADPVLLDRLALAKLEEVADTVRAEGWKWVEVGLEPPVTFQMGRAYPSLVDLSPENQARHDAVQSAYEEAVVAYDRDGDPEGVLAARLEALAAERQQLDAKRRAFTPEVLARAGAFVSLERTGKAQVDRGFVRREDETPVIDLDADDTPEAEKVLRRARLPDRLVADLTAHRTAALCDQLGQQPGFALAALTHAVAASTFHRGGRSCLEVRTGSVDLSTHAPGIRETVAGAAIEARHAAWDAELPDDEATFWAAVVALPADRQLALLAHCVGLTANAVEVADRTRDVRTPADRLAAGLRLDMTTYWSASAETYLGRVSKPFIQAAMREAVSDEAARRLDGMKKDAMARTAETLLAEAAWLPEVLRSEPPADAPSERLEAAE